MKVFTFICLSVLFAHQLCAQEVSKWTHNWGGQSGYTHLTEGFDQWISMRLSHKSTDDERWTILPQAGVYRRFGLWGIDAALDAYYSSAGKWLIHSKLRKGFAPYLPIWDVGTTITRYTGPLEWSIGYRQMHFDRMQHLIPIGAGIYFGNYWLSYTYTRGLQDQTRVFSNANVLVARKYMTSPLQYLEIKALQGQELNVLTMADQVTKIPQQMVSVAYFHPISKQSIGWYFSMIRENIRSDIHRLRISAGIIIK